jgi:polyisoprenyl-phosphate glycosyltransferase
MTHPLPALEAATGEDRETCSGTKEQRPLISIVVPVYNEEDNVQSLYDAVNAVMAQVADRYRWEFIFTDNHSEDRTFERLTEIGKDDDRVCVYRFSRNFGFQRSIYTGFMMADGDAAIQIDCDLQDPPVLILQFLDLWRRGNKVVYGVRRSRQEGFFITSARKLFYRLIDHISDFRLPKDAGDFRLLDRRVIDELSEHRNRNPYLRGIIARIGFNQVGVVYDRMPRERGSTKFTFGSLIDLAIDGIVNNSVVPLRLAVYGGVIVGIVSLISAIAVIVQRLFFERTWPAGFAFLAVTVLSFFSANMIFLGIIGEYLSRTHNQVIDQPLTIVDLVIDRRHNSADRAGRAGSKISGCDLRNQT